MDMDISCSCSIKKKNLSGYSFLQRARLLLHATLQALVLSPSSSSSSSSTPTINRITKADKTHKQIHRDSTRKCFRMSGKDSSVAVLCVGLERS
jgi:23S rRNA G2069 N7-methylase RlmK/C1962 C5-methylase RlmI